MEGSQGDEEEPAFSWLAQGCPGMIGPQGRPTAAGAMLLWATATVSKEGQDKPSPLAQRRVEPDSQEAKGLPILYCKLGQPGAPS